MTAAHRPERDAGEVGMQRDGCSGLPPGARVLASPAVYARVRRDLALIRDRRPTLQGIRALPSWVPGSIILGFDEAAVSEVEAGAYEGRSCANAYYGARTEAIHRGC